MSKTTFHATGRQTGGYVHRNEQAKWVIVVGCTFAVLGLVAMALAAYDWRPTVKQADTAASPRAHQGQTPLRVSEGTVLSRQGRKCRVLIFDNETGRSRDGGLAACAGEAGAVGKYSYPSARLKSIRKSLAKE